MLTRVVPWHLIGHYPTLVGLVHTSLIVWSDSKLTTSSISTKTCARSFWESVSYIPQPKLELNTWVPSELKIGTSIH